jgi:hypothetical protein
MRTFKVYTHIEHVVLKPMFMYSELSIKELYPFIENMTGRHVLRVEEVTPDEDVPY